MKTHKILKCLLTLSIIVFPSLAYANPAIGTLSDRVENAKKTGSAVLISNAGHVLTSSALVGRRDEMFFRHGSTDSAIPTSAVIASVIAVDEDLGVALLKLDDTGSNIKTPVVFSKKIGTESRLVKSLYTNDNGLINAEGAIGNTLVKDTGGSRFLKHNAMIEASGYGGALSNECGELVGINVVDPFLSIRRARQMPEPGDSVYAADISGILKFLDARSVTVTTAVDDCLSASEKAAELEKQREDDKAEFDKKSQEKQAELDRVERDLAEKEERSKAARERADEAERTAKQKAAEVERLKKDKKASAEERQAAEEDARTAREAAEKAAIEAANRAKEINALKDEQDALKLAIEAAEKRQKQLLIGGGIGFALLTLFASLMIGRRSKALKEEKVAKADVIQQLNATFSDIECRGQDQNNAPHAFIISGNSLLKSPQGLVIGRQPQSSDILINHPEISRAHLRASLKDNLVYVEDLGSTNGSTLNGITLAPHSLIRLSSGDMLTLGKVTFQVRFLDA